MTLGFPTGSGLPPITQIAFSACRAHYPGGSARCCRSVFNGALPRRDLPNRMAFPEQTAGRHPHLFFRGLLKLHSRYGLQSCSPTLRGLLSRGSRPASYPGQKQLASYQGVPTPPCVGPSPTGDLRRWGARSFRNFDLAGRVREAFSACETAVERRSRATCNQYPKSYESICRKRRPTILCSSPRIIQTEISSCP